MTIRASRFPEIPSCLSCSQQKDVVPIDFISHSRNTLEEMGRDDPKGAGVRANPLVESEIRSATLSMHAYAAYNTPGRSVFPANVATATLSKVVDLIRAIPLESSCELAFAQRTNRACYVTLKVWNNFFLGFGFNLSKGTLLGTSAIKVLVVEDYEPFRRFLISTLRSQADEWDLRAVSDGLEAVREAQRLQPDLILLDIGLPTLNGLNAARRIRTLSPTSKIIFVTQESSADVVQEALSIGASGYVVKADAGRELIAAVAAVLRGEQFVGSRFAGHDLSGTSNLRTNDASSHDEYPATGPIPIRAVEAAHRHAALFYSNDDFLLDGLTRCIANALNGGNAVLVFASELHRNSLISRLQAHGIDATAAIDQRRYVPLDPEDILSKFMVDNQPEPSRLFKVLNDVIATVSSGNGGTRIVACGGLAPVLLSQGKPESAIRLEQLWDQVVKRYGLDTLCTYSRSSFESEQDSDVFQRICGLHSPVHSR